MANRTSGKLFLLWLFAAFLALAAAAIGYFRSGEVNAIALIFAAISIVMAFVSRSKGRGSDA
jgi:hypothetical protein